jgi:hypothetical protein
MSRLREAAIAAITAIMAITVGTVGRHQFRAASPDIIRPKDRGWRAHA